MWIENFKGELINLDYIYHITLVQEAQGSKGGWGVVAWGEKRNYTLFFSTNKEEAEKYLSNLKKLFMGETASARKKGGDR